MYKLSKAIVRLYGTRTHTNLNGFRFLMSRGPKYTIAKYRIVYTIVGIGESTISHPLVLVSGD